MKIEMKERIRLTVNFFKALGTKDQNSVVAIIREGTGGAITSADLSEEFVEQFKQLLTAKQQRIAAGKVYDGRY